MRFTLKCFLAMSFALLAGASVMAQRPDAATLIAAQKAAMGPLVVMDGVWRGPAWTILPSGEKHNVTQTERIGPFLDGSVKVIEGRGYDSEGKVSFNAFGIVSFDPGKKAYTLHSYAQGQSGDFVLKPIPDGYIWEIPVGPMTIRYTATIKDGAWLEVGDRIVEGKEPQRFFEMKLKRVGDTTWPAANPVPMQ
ncbi:MAG TPA: hypothetical protein VGN86_09140 [Pyrinomonadaceae bacterium]|jgi:hypothetical protein|nr:hypothetical protein [Pyrinomonadaceae bacterium]